MASEVRPKRVIIFTDYALGDDHGAVLALCAYASLHKDTKFSFVGAYGNRSTQESVDNLATQLPRLWTRLGQSLDTCPDVYYGADRPSQSDSKYEVGADRIERVIHDDFSSENTENKLPIEQTTDRLYQTLKEGSIPVALLSLGAPTEAVKAAQELGNLVQCSVAMLGAGAIQGNTGPHREANATHDPAKNRELLELSKKFDIPFTLIQQDCTEQAPVLVDKATLRALEKELGQQSFAMQELNSIASENSVYGKFYLGQSYREAHFPFRNKQYHGVPLHDLTAAMAFIDLLSKEDQKMFRYAKLVPVVFLPDGSDGKGRGYFDPPPTNVDLAGPIERSYKDVILGMFGTRLREKYWQEIIKLLKLYN